MHPKLARATSWLDHCLRCYILVLMALLVILTFTQVVARYVFKAPFTSTEEYTRLVLVWLTFMGAAMAVRLNRLVRIEVIEEHLPSSVRMFLNTFFDLVLIGLLSVIIVKGWEAVIVTDSQVVAGTPLSYSAYTLSIFVGASIMILYVSLRTLERLIGQRSR